MDNIKKDVLQQELDALRAETERLKQENQELRDKHDKLNQEKRDLKAEVLAQLVDNDKIRTMVESAKQKVRNCLLELQADNEELLADNEKLLADNNLLKAEVVRLQAKLKNLEDKQKPVVVESRRTTLQEPARRRRVFRIEDVTPTPPRASGT